MKKIDYATLSTYLPPDAFWEMSAFGALSDSFVQELLTRGDLLATEPGEMLFEAGGRANCFYVVLKGGV